MAGGWIDPGEAEEKNIMLKLLLFTVGVVFVLLALLWRASGKATIPKG